MISIDLTELADAASEIVDEVEVDMREFHRRLAEAGQNDSFNTFSTSTSPTGDRWLPSALATRERRRTLSRTNTLRNSIQISFDREEAFVGTDVFYGRFHQFGEGNQEQRQFLGIDPESVLRVIDIMYGDLI